MSNKIITSLFLIVLSLSIGKASQAQSLPQGCFAGTISSGVDVRLKITKGSKNRYRVIELSDLNFHGAPYTSRVDAPLVTKGTLPPRG